MKKIIIAALAFIMLFGVSAYADETENMLYANSFCYGLKGISDLQKSSETGGYEIKTMDTKKVLSVYMGLSQNNKDRSSGVMMGPDDTESYTLSVNMRGQQTIKADGIIFFNVNSGAEFYALRVYSDGTMKICKNSIFSSVGGTGEGMLPENTKIYFWNNFRIKSDRGIIEVYVNNSETPSIVWEDSSPLTGGKVGFGVFGATYASAEMYFSDVKITTETAGATAAAQAVLSNGIAFTTGSPVFFINGEENRIDAVNPDVVPYIEEDRTMIPLRALGEAIGFDVGWSEGKITLTKDEITLGLTSGSDICYINGDPFTLTNKVTIKQNRSFVPLRNITELFGKKVLWKDNGVIVISDDDMTNSVTNEIAELIGKKSGKPY